MFYAHFILSKKGPLARIWLAAHWEKKLTKAQIFDTDIDKAVDYILEPKVKMALRTKGHLLLGVCKIYSRKTKYLLADCNETCSRMRLVFRPYAVNIDLPEDQAMAPFDAITNQEVFHDFDAAGLDISLNQSRYEDITLMEHAAAVNPAVYNIENDFGFGDEEEIEAHRQAASGGRLDFSDIGRLRTSNAKKLSGLGENASGNRIDITPFLEMEDGNPGIMLDNQFDMAVPGPNEDGGLPANIDGQRTPLPVPTSPIPPPSAAEKPSDAHGMTTLLSNAAVGFVLPPLDEGTVMELSRQRGTRKRRRCLMVDQETIIQPEAFKKQITDYKDTMRPLALGPDTKRKMYMKEHDAADYLFINPCIEIGSKTYEQVFVPNLKTRQRPDEQDVNPGITLIDPEEAAEMAQPEVPALLEPIIEDVELERQQQSEPVQDAIDQPMDIDMPPENDHQFLKPLLPPPIRSSITSPKGNENEAPPPFHSVLMSPFVELTDQNGPPQAILAERNSSTPNPQLSSTPRRSPRKDQKNRLSQAIEAAEGENNLDLSRASHVSTSWDEKAQDILVKLRSRMNWLRETPSMTFEETIDARDTRKTVARKFYALLELKKSRMVDVKQEEPYGQIIISGGQAFDISAVMAD